MVLKRLDLGVFRRRIVWGLGALNSLAFKLQNVGLVYTTASKTSLLVNVNIVFIAILMALVFHEHVTWQKVLGISVGVMGVVVLATRLNPEFLRGSEFLGTGSCSSPGSYGPSTWSARGPWWTTAGTTSP